ncbi:MAG TPA: type II toxin-antitoxin system RelE/ParE family toxin [Alphaproteobacteria bacterium]
MKKYQVRFRPLAEADLFKLHDYIAQHAGLNVAGDYIGRLEAACAALETFPLRGTSRGHIRPGLRTIGFERRATIAFQVRKTDVVIVRVLYGGQDFEHALRKNGEE